MNVLEDADILEIANSLKYFILEDDGEIRTVDNPEDEDFRDLLVFAREIERSVLEVLNK